MRKAPKPQGKPNDRCSKVAALLVAASAVAENRTFADATRAILAACTSMLGASTGFVGVRAPGGRDLEVTLVDPGGLALDFSAGFPAPLRPLSARALKLGRPVFTNVLSKRAATVSPRARGRAALPHNALVAPVVVAGEVAGFVGLLDKPGGFSAADCRLAAVFAEMTSVAMLNGREIDLLQQDRNGLAREVREGATHLFRAEEQFKTLVENLPDIIARFDADLRHIYVSPSIERVTGRPPQDFVGRTNRDLEMPPELVEVLDAALRRVFATGEAGRIEFAFPAQNGTRYFDCRLVPERGPGGAVTSVLCVARDVTDKRLAHEVERRGRANADALREATVALTRSLDRETVLLTLLDRLRGIVPFDRASVMLLDEASRVSVRAVFDGDRVVPLTPGARPQFDPADHPIVRSILTTGTPVLVPDVRAHPGWSLPTDLSSEVSWMGVPLFARAYVAGLFSLSKREAGYFNEEHMKLAETLSSQASVAVENAILFEQMQASSVRMKALSHRLVATQESERRHIARELHDEAGQALVSLRFGLRLLEREIDEGGSVTQRVAELMQRTNAVIDGLHRLAADLRPPSLDPLGLESALREYVRSAGSEFGVAARFKARGLEGRRLPTDVETALYRVVQEAITNVARHARATRVDVLMEHRSDRVIVLVEDDGVGFNPDQAQRGDHFGLLGMKERAESLGGILTVESAPGAGTTIVLEAPIADSNPDR